MEFGSLEFKLTLITVDGSTLSQIKHYEKKSTEKNNSTINKNNFFLISKDFQRIFFIGKMFLLSILCCTNSTVSSINLYI